MVSAKMNFLSVHQCTLQCTLTGSFPLFDFFDLTQIIFHENLCKLLNIKIDVRAKFQIQSNEKGKLIFSTSLSSGATGNRTGDTGILTILYNCLLEVAVEEAFEALAVTRLVLSHFVYCIVDCVKIELLGTLCDAVLVGTCA